MLALEQLISQATALSDSDKIILIEKLVESMTGETDLGLLAEGVRIAQERMAEIDRGEVEPIPGEAALAQIRQLLGT